MKGNQSEIDKPGTEELEETYYFAYGSNMNLDQMEFRCPHAEVARNVRLEGYCLAFRGRNPGNGVATILPREGCHVDGVLWKITRQCEESLDRYEGYPHLYGKEKIRVSGRGKENLSAMAYVMNEPYKDCPSKPSDYYLKGILEGCRQNQLPVKPVMEAVRRTRQEMEQPGEMSQNRRKTGRER